LNVGKFDLITRLL